jgi:O-antigen/teichoic acid export membrane protein
MRQSHLLLYNALIIWGTKVLQLVPQLILVPFLIHRIGDAGYGVYALVWSLMMSIDQLENSLQSGVVKYSAAFLVEKRMDDVNKVISSCFIYSIILAVVACMGTLAAATIFDNQSGEMFFPLMVVGVMVLFVVPLTPYIAIIRSQQRYDVGALSDTLSKYFTLFMVFLWFKAVGPSVEALIVISAAMLFLSRLAQVPFAYRLVPGLRNSSSLFDWQVFRLIFLFGGVTVLASLCLVANTTGVRWLMGTMVSTGFVAHLAIILMPGVVLSQIVQAMTLTVMPATSAYEAVGNYQILKEMLIRSIRYTVILVSAGVIAAVLMMKNVLGIWVGSEYEFLATYTLVVFASIAFLQTASSAHHMLKGMGKLRITLINALVGAVIVPVGLILAVYLIWRNPYTAVTVGLAVGNVVYGVIQIGFGMKAVHTDFREMFMRAYGQPLIVAVLVVALAIGLVTYGGITSHFGRILVSFLAVLLFFIGSYFFTASRAERQQISEFQQLALHRIASFRRMLPGFKSS